MVAVEEICIDCGKKFLRGIYPQKRCDFCSMKNHISFSIIEVKWKMKLVLAKPSYLKDSISIISNLVMEGKFKISQKGISLYCMDSANIAFVGFKKE